MRYAWVVAFLAVTAVPALAEDKPASHGRMSWEARFAQANVAHDGHLTLDEAKTGYKTVARHFKEIDTESKGYVTENDIRAWRALQRAARHAPQQEDPLRPRPAFARTPGEQRTMAPSNAQSLVLAPGSDLKP